MSPSTWCDTVWMSITSRLSVRVKGSLRSRTTVSVTGWPTAPRMDLTASLTGAPWIDLPSMAVM